MFSCARSGSSEKRSFTQLLFRGRGKGSTTPKSCPPDVRPEFDADQTPTLTPRSDVCQSPAPPAAIPQEAAVLFPIAADATQRTPRTARSERQNKDIQPQRDQNGAASQRDALNSNASKASQSQEATTPVKLSPRLRSGHNTPRVKAVLPEGNLQQLESDYQDLQAQFHVLRSSPHWKQGSAARESVATGVSPRNSTPSRMSPSPRNASIGASGNRAAAKTSVRAGKQGTAAAAAARRTMTPRRGEAGRNVSPMVSRGLTKASPRKAAADVEMDVAASQASMDSSQASLRLPMPPFAANAMSMRGSFAAASRHTSPASLLPAPPTSTTSTPTTFNVRQSMIPTITGIPGSASDTNGMGLNLRLAQGEFLTATKPTHANATIATAPSAVQRTHTAVSDMIVTKDTVLETVEPPTNGLTTTDFIIQHQEPNKRSANMAKQPACVVTAEAVHGKKSSFKWGGFAGKVKAIFKSNKQ